MPIEKAPKTPATAPEFKAPDAPADDAQADDAQAVKDDTLTPNPDVPEEEEYEFYRMPNGKLRAVRKADIQDMSATDVENPNIPVQDVYVWLTDGSVERIREDRLPGHAGTNAAHGFYVRDGKTYQIVGVYPVETEEKGA